MVARRCHQLISGANRRMGSNQPFDCVSIGSGFVINVFGVRIPPPLFEKGCGGLFGSIGGDRGFCLVIGVVRWEKEEKREMCLLNPWLDSSVVW